MTPAATPPGLARAGRIGGLRASFVAGLVLVMPVGLTLWLMWSFAGWMDGVVLPLLPGRLRPEHYIGLDLHGVGIVFFLLFTVAVGWFARGWTGQWVIRSAERLVRRTPVVRSIYVGSKQIAEALVTEDGDSFDRVCLVEYPRPGIWALGFISAVARGELGETVRGHSDVIGVLVPTTPNPTTGFLLLLPRRTVIELEMSLEDGVKMVMSAGLVQAGMPPAAAEAS